jgi:hypothetical protein
VDRDADGMVVAIRAYPRIVFAALVIDNFLLWDKVRWAGSVGRDSLTANAIALTAVELTPLQACDTSWTGPRDIREREKVLIARYSGAVTAVVRSASAHNIENA